MHSTEAQRIDFVRQYLPYVQDIAKQYNIPAHSILGQWALESDWGTVTTGKNNIFGIKSIDPKSKTRVRSQTQEQFTPEELKNWKEKLEGREVIKDLGQDFFKQSKPFQKEALRVVGLRSVKGLQTFMKNQGIECRLANGVNCNMPQAYEKSLNELSEKAAQGDQAAKTTLSKFGSKVATAGKLIKGALGPLALATEVAVDLAIPLNTTLQEGIPYKQAFADTLINKYILGPKLQVDKEAEIAKEMAKGEEFAMAKRGERMFLPQSATADAQRLKKREEEMKALYPQLDMVNLPNKEIDELLAAQRVYSPFTLGFGMQQKQPGIGDMRYNEDVAYDEIRDIFNKGAEEDIRKQQMQSIADAGGVANLAGGGIAKLAGVDQGPPPESGPNPQGLQGLLNRVKKV